MPSVPTRIKKGIIISAVISLLVIVIAWYFSMAYDIYDAYKINLEEGYTDYTVSFIDSIRLVPFFLEDPEIARPYFGNLALGLLFSLLGSGSFVFNKLRNTGKKKAPPIEPLPVVEQNEEETNESKEESHVDH